MSSVNLEHIRDYLCGLPHGESRKLAKATGLSEQTLTNIRRGRMKNPRWETMVKINQYREMMND